MTAPTPRHQLPQTECLPLVCYLTKHKVQLWRLETHPHELSKMRALPAGLVDILAISPSWLCSQLHPPQWKSTGLSADCVTVVKSRRPVRRAGVRLPRHVTGSPSMRCTAAPLNSFQLWQKQEATVASCPDKDKQTQEGSVARPMLKALAWIRQQWPRLRRNWGNKGWKERLPLTDKTCLFYCRLSVSSSVQL